MNVYECLLVVRGAVWCTLAAAFLTVCPRAVVAYHHQSECEYIMVFTKSFECCTIQIQVIIVINTM